MQKVFTLPGDAIVRLRVTDDRGVSTIAAMTIPVSGPPVASFDVSASPTAGRPVTFTSTSHVTGGAVASLQWDLDGNGLFNDAAGETATYTYATPGSYTVSLRVTDTSGRTNVAFRSITVRAEPAVSGSGRRRECRGPRGPRSSCCRSRSCASRAASPAARRTSRCSRCAPRPAPASA